MKKKSLFTYHGFNPRNLFPIPLLLISLIFFPSLSYSASVPISIQGPAQEKLEEEILKRLDRVKEFQTIKKLAQEMGVRVYLFGGTAAAYAHYVRWDLLREAGDDRYQPGKFDYDYTSIFRSNQDMDIVVDAEPEKAAQLEKKMQDLFPFFQGARSVWEMRPLRHSIGDKEPLLNNKDFLQQHTDSNSTGMIELTEATSQGQTEGRIRDLRDWNNQHNSHFIKDIHRDGLHFYFSPDHEKTNRFKKGLNPPIISVIRFLTKAFQYELEVTGEDREVIKKIIQDFKENSARYLQDSYVQHWMEKNAKKLLQNAVNIEYAWNTLENLGLRRKLAEIGSKEVGGLGWWMDKEPLRTLKLGSSNPNPKAQGKTAKKLGITTVAHETNNFAAYESITMSSRGEANVFISRNGVNGEAAAHGDGFYTANGRKGMRGTGITIRFEVNPEAVEGVDFKDLKNGMVLILNKAAIKTIPESMNFSVVQFFEMLDQGFQFDRNDKAVEEKVRRKLKNRSTTTSEEEIQKVVDLVKRNVSSQGQNAVSVLGEWFSMEVSQKHPEIFQQIVSDKEFLAKHGDGILEGANFRGLYLKSLLGDPKFRDQQAQFFSQTGTLPILIKHLIQANAMEDLREILKGRTPSELNQRAGIVGNTALGYAIHSWNEEAIKILFEAGANPYEPVGDYHEKTGLFWAVAEDKPDVVNFILQKYPIEENSPQKLMLWDAFVLAISHKNSNIIKVFLKYHPNLINKDIFKDPTALEKAIMADSEENVKILLEAGADPDEVLPFWISKRNVLDKYTPLNWAVEKGYSSLVNLLLEKNVNVNKRGRHQQTAVMIAAKSKNKVILEALLKHKPNLEVRDNFHLTALGYAAQNRDEEMMKMLLEAGGDPEQVLWDLGRYPSLKLVSKNAGKEQEKYNKGKVEDVDNMARYKHTVLTWAEQYGSKEFKKFLHPAGPSSHENLCLSVYKNQKIEVGKLAGEDFASPILLPLRTLELAGTLSIPSNKKNPIEYVAGTVAFGIHAGVGLAANALIIPKHLLSTGPSHAVAANGIRKIHKVLKEADRVYRDQGGVIPESVELKGELDHLWKKVNKKLNGRQGAITKQKLVETIYNHSRKGTFCPEGTVYFHKGLFNEIVQGLVENDHYHIPSRIYEKTGHFWFPKLFQEDARRAVNHRTLSSKERFKGKEKLYSGEESASAAGPSQSLGI